MRAILEIPEDLYQALSERSAREGRSASGLAAEILRDSLELPAPMAPPPADRPDAPAATTEPTEPPWFGMLRTKIDPNAPHDMEAIRRSIGRGIGKERGL